MSCFGGRMQEYDRVSLDRFDGKNLQSTVYFLSHLHEDHTVGLAEKIFFKRLKSNKDIFLYCSEVTQVLLASSKKYHHLEPYIKPLGINTPTSIVIPDPLYEEKEIIAVTLLPAFHCPGSVMILIEGKEGTVLYTGDFRWEHFHIEQMHHLRSGDSVKKIKSLYVDTTFCSPDSLHIPSRQQCIDAVYQLVHEWTSNSPKHVVNIYLRAQYGHEPLLNAVASRLNKKVHVNERKVAIYDRIQEFHGNFTADGANTQLHACDKDCMIDVDGETMLCREAHDRDKVLVILPTTMYFTQFQHLTLDKIVKKVGSNFFRACYSFHSSYTEVKDLISYLKPQRVYPNVKPPSDSSLAVIQHRLNSMLKECIESGAGEAIQSEDVKELGTLKTRSGRQVKRKGRESASDAESLDFGTPTKVAKFSLSSSLETGEPASPSESAVVTRKGRGRGRGISVTQTTSQPAVGTRRSTRRSAVAPSEDTTPKKAKKSERSPTPDLFLTPASDTSEQHSSFCGSERSDSELSLFSSQKSLDLVLSGEAATTWMAGSFLAAVSSSSEDDVGAGRFLLDDEEQTDEQYQDVTQFTDTEEEEESINTENLESATEMGDQLEGEETGTSPDIVKSKGKTRSPVKKGKSGRKGKRTNQVNTNEDNTESSIGYTDSHREVEGSEIINSKSKITTGHEQKSEVKGNEGIDEIDGIKPTIVDEKGSSDSSVSTNTVVKKGEPSVHEVPLKDIDSEKIDASKTQADENINDNGKIHTNNKRLEENQVLKYLGTKVKTVDDSGPLSVKSVKTEEKSKMVYSVRNEGISSETASAEDLHSHMSETTRGDEENGGTSNLYGRGAKSNEIVEIDSESDEDESNEQVNDASTSINTEVGRSIRRSESENSEEIGCDESKVLTNDEIMIIDSDSNEVSNSVCIGINKVKGNSENNKSEEQTNGHCTEINQQSEVLVNLSYSDDDKAIERDWGELDGLVEEVTEPESTGQIEHGLLKSDSLLHNTGETTLQITNREETKDNADDGESNQTSSSIEILEENTTKIDSDQSSLVSSGMPRRICEDRHDGISMAQSINKQPKILSGSSETNIEFTDNDATPEVINDNVLDENNDAKEDEDDVIEIVDLTGDEQSSQFETQDRLKPGKKTIKISLLNKPDPVNRIKKVVETTSKECDKEKEKNGHQKYESDSDEEIEISSSPEWLSVKKAKGKRHRSDKSKAKKSHVSKTNSSEDNEMKNVDESSECDSNLDSTLKFSKRELEEKDEVRRQALGFICETDSDSDTDESSAPDSPAADMLYDDYVELSSDSDNENGIGRRNKGERSMGRKSTNQRGTGGGSGSRSDSGRSGGSTQGWLSAIKNMDNSESTVQDTAVNKETHTNTSGGDILTEQANVEIVPEQTVLIPDKNSVNTLDISQSNQCPVLDSNSSLHSTESSKLIDDNASESVQEIPGFGTEFTSLDTSENNQSDSYCEKDTSSKTEEESSIMEQSRVSLTKLNDQNVVKDTLLKDNHLEMIEVSDTSEKTTTILQEADITSLSTNSTDETEMSEVQNSDKEGNRVEGPNANESDDTKLDKVKTADRADVFSTSDNTFDTNGALGTSGVKSKCKLSEKKELAEKTKIKDTMQEQPKLVQEKSASTSKIPLLVQKSHSSDSSMEDSQKEKPLQISLSEICKSSKATSCDTSEQEINTRKEECAVVLSRSAVHSQDKQTNKNLQSSKKEKADYMKNIAQTNMRHTSDFEVHLDQPPPPGTEEPHSLKREAKQISSVISTRRPVKGVPVTPPTSPAISTSSPLYSLFVSGGAYPSQPEPSPAGPYHFPHSAAAFPMPPPGWNQYGHYPPGIPHPGAPPPSFSVPPPAFTQPPPNVPYSSAAYTNTMASTTSVTSTSTAPSNKSVSLSSTGVAIASVAPSVITTKYKAQDPISITKHSTVYVPSATAKTDPTQTHATTTKPKKLAPWQQKKANVFDRGPSCLAKKDYTPKITGYIGKSPSEHKHTDTNTWTVPESRGQKQGNYEGHLSRLTQHGFKPNTQSTDMSTIKANISALTGLSVARLENTPTSVPTNLGGNQSEAENIPDLVEKLKKLEQMQAVLEAVTGGTKEHATPCNVISAESSEISRQTFQYDHHSTHAEYHDTSTYDPYDERQLDRDRRSRVEGHEIEHRRKSHEYESRDRVYDERFRSREYYYDSRGRGNDDYKRSERDTFYRTRERDVEYERYDRIESSYSDYDRREKEFERRYRDEEDYRTWLEERRRGDYYRREVKSPPRLEGRSRDDFCRREVRRSPPRYGGRRPSDLEFMEWQEERRRNFRDQHDSYDYPPPPRPRENDYPPPPRPRENDYPPPPRPRENDYPPPPRPRSPYFRHDPQLAFDSKRSRRHDDSTEPYDNYERRAFGAGESVSYGAGGSGESVSYGAGGAGESVSYGAVESVSYGGLETNPEQGYPDTTTEKQPYPAQRKPFPFFEPAKRKPVMARVLSRSGQLISLQSSEALLQAPAATRSEEKQENTDRPVFHTGMRYYSAPTDQ